jgi:hypothetical protein
MLTRSGWIYGQACDAYQPHTTEDKGKWHGR